MSCSTSISYGYGFPVGSVTEKALAEFIKNHASVLNKTDVNGVEYERLFVQEITSWLDNPDFDWDNFGMEEYFADYEDDIYNGNTGFGAVISNVMSRETDIAFCFQMGQDDCDSEPTVMLMAGMPWGFSIKESSLSLDEMDNICRKYMKELGLDGEPDYQSVEYYG